MTFKQIRLFVLFLLLSLMFAAHATAQDEEETEITLPDETLTVAIRDLDPFVFQRGDLYTGFSIEIWEQIASELGLTYEYLEVETVSDQLQAVEDGEADIAITAISITSDREETLDFSMPYFESGLQIMIRNEDAVNLVDILNTLFSPELLSIIGFFLFVIVVVAHIVWLVERSNNAEHFPHAYLPGIWEALWWTAVTVTTVGYGDRTLKGVAGRLLGLVWMFVGIFLIAYFTASVTSIITVQALSNKITDSNDLVGKTIATVNGSTAATYVEQIRVRMIGLEAIEDAYRLLEEKQVDAIIYDGAVLLHYANTASEGRVVVLPSDFAREYYGIAMAPDSIYREPINRTILSMRETGIYDDIHIQWFGEKER